MNPIKNKKDLEATIEEIRKFSYAYLEKYSPSKQQLRTYLFKKFLKGKHKTFNKKDLSREKLLGMMAGGEELDKLEVELKEIDRISAN